MSASGVLRLARAEISRLAHAGLDSFAYRRQAVAKLAKVVPFDGFWWWTTDPATAFFTSGVFEPCPDEHSVCRLIHKNEFVDPDYNKFRVLARRPVHVGVLSDATDGMPERSDRYRRVLAPLGYEHELRLALTDGASCWGALALLRGSGSAGFSPSEARIAGSVCGPLTEGLRIGLVLGAVSVDCAPNGPGLIALDDDQEVLTMTTNAEHWLDELRDGSPGLRNAIRSVVACVRELDHGGNIDGQTPRARVRGRSGRWLVIHGSRTRDTGGRNPGTAIIIEEAAPSEIAPIIVRAYGLSERATKVTRLILHGLSTKEIAAELCVSAYTIQDHLKSIFEKVGVRSRRELVAHIYDQYYIPNYGHGEHPPGPDGAVAGLHAAEASLALTGA
jgi:DNA-binding CsgD family transcriptional regulator